jgi:hypothetical protein
MKPIKDFDCVQMKWDIQRKLLEEERQFRPEEARRRRNERVRNDPILGPFLQRLEAQEHKKASENLDRIAGNNRSDQALKR